MTRTLKTLAAALVVGLAAAPAASAKAHSTFTITGAGFGHGVGMSQYGALGYAEHGWNATAILEHYYTGTTLGTTDPTQTVRVLLGTPSRARISGASQAGTRKLDPGLTYTVRRHGVSSVDLYTGSKRAATFTSPLQIAGAGGVASLAGYGRYRGVLEFTPGTFSGLTIVNAVGLDDYVQGVVPAESPASWPLEALKAQAIAARTYAITTSHSGTFDQYADTRSQVYRGVSVETIASNQAVSQTRGQVVEYGGQPVTTYFFSTSGGRTENVENAFGGAPEPWLKSVDDPYDNVSPRHRWQPDTLSLASAARRLRGLYAGSFRGIRVTKRGVSPRIITAQVVGSRGSTTLSGSALRARLGLFDTWAYFKTISTAPAVPAPSDPTGGTPAPGATAARARWALSGSVLFAARGSALTVQVLRGGRWTAAGTTSTGTGGAYRWATAVAGTYRVVSGQAPGPAVRLG
jgi:stage II sporulation protein D